MNRPCTLTLLVGCSCAVSSVWAEPTPRPLPGAATAVPEQWQYHEKWDKTKQPGQPPAKGLLPGSGCHPGGPPQGTVRAVPPAGRCADAPVRVRT